MLRFVLPLALGLIGLAAGAGAGYMLRPPPAETSDPEAAAPPAGDHASPDHAAAAGHAETPREYVKLNNQFIVPLVEHGRVNAMVILALSIEIDAGEASAVYAQEPKLRDALLQALFEHANAGGFRGSFTDTVNMRLLRQSLREAVRAILGNSASDVLITDIVRQDT